MNQLPDAPWIRDAELNGFDDEPTVECPVCAWINCKYIYVSKSDWEPVGCEHCIVELDAHEWLREKEADRDDT